MSRDEKPFFNYYLTRVTGIVYYLRHRLGGFSAGPALKESGDVAQLGERGVRNAEVRGSIPLISTMDKETGCFF